MGDTVHFRGNRRFVVQCRFPGGLIFERIRTSHKRSLAYYSISEREKSELVVVRSGTEDDRARARKLYEDSQLPHTRIEWDGDDPIYVHTIAGQEHRMDPRKKSRG